MPEPALPLRCNRSLHTVRPAHPLRRALPAATPVTRQLLCHVVALVQCGQLPRYLPSPLPSAFAVRQKTPFADVRTVWRYLQESGFGNAALQLSRCWIRDPDTLPFASSVEPHTLIRILQDGMYFDQLQAETTNVRACVPSTSPSSTR